MTLYEMTAQAWTSPLMDRRDEDRAGETNCEEITWRMNLLAGALDVSPAEVVASGRIGKALPLCDGWWEFLSTLPARLPFQVGASSRDCAWQAEMSLADLSITAQDLRSPDRMVKRLEIDARRVSWAFVVREEDTPERRESLLLFDRSGELLLSLRVPRERGRVFLFGYHALARKGCSPLQNTTAIHRLAQRSPASTDKASVMMEFLPVRKISVPDCRLLLDILADHLLPLQGVVGTSAAVAGWKGGIHRAAPGEMGGYRFGNISVCFLSEGEEETGHRWRLEALMTGAHEGLVLRDHGNRLWLSIWLQPGATRQEKSAWLAVIDTFIRSREATQ